MEPDQLFSLLAGFTVQLQSPSADDGTALLKIQENLASALINQSGGTFNFQQYVFQHSDIFSAQKLSPENVAQLQQVIEKAAAKPAKTETKVVLRDTAVRSTQLGSGAAKTVAGTRVSKTIGPIKTVDGRGVFLDFINVRKLIALYIAGQSTPAVLFNTTVQQRRITLPGTKPALAQTYTVLPDTVWINAKLLAATAPPNLYCPLRVKGGKITLSEMPAYAGDLLTVAAGVTISVALDLEQHTTFENDPDSPYGADARDATLELPKTFAFDLTGTNRSVKMIGESSWNVYGQAYAFNWGGDQTSVYNPLITRVAFPLTCSEAVFTIKKSVSPFLQLDGSAPIKTAWWTIPAASIDITKPLEADGNGGFVLECGSGIASQWGTAKEKTALKTPFFIGEAGRIGITDFMSNGNAVVHKMESWRDAQNPFGTSIEIRYRKDAAYIFNTLAKGDEVLLTVADALMKVDRPVQVNGEAVAVRSANSAVILAVNKTRNAIALIDDNMLWDNKLPADKIPVVKPLALALHNALFTATPVNGAILFGECDKDFTRIDKGNLYLSFGLYSYLPTLPDPYAANLGILKGQFFNQLRDAAGNLGKRGSRVWMWLVCQVRWTKQTPAADQVDVSFHFAPLNAALNVVKDTDVQVPGATNPAPLPAVGEYQNVLLQRSQAAQPPSAVSGTQKFTPLMYSAARGAEAMNVQLEDFALLDVSSNANQMGIAYSGYNQQNKALIRTFNIQQNGEGDSAQAFPIQVSGMDIVTAGINARAFTVPQVAWEPVLNFTKPGVDPAPSAEWPDPTNDPPLGFNYYPNDGFATRIGNFSQKPVPLSPIPMIDYLEKTYQSGDDGKIYAIFNLPFGMFAISVLDKKSQQDKKPEVENVKPVFTGNVNGGMQFELRAGSPFSANDEDHLFQGYTFQLINVRDIAGNTNNSSTLGSSVSSIFNNEFSKVTAGDFTRPAVPLTRIGLSGYGASIFSDWHNRSATFAATSQAMFRVATGRTSHEVVQVKSVIYPWGIFVVRTITLFRLNNGYVGRVDSGWNAETDGRFYFNVKPNPNPYEVHPGLIKGVFNVRNIRENTLTYTDDTIYKTGDPYFDPNTNLEKPYPGPDKILPKDTKLRGLNFDCEIEIENVIEGADASGRVPCREMLGFVQLSPRGSAIRPDTFAGLLQSQGNAIGGPVNCTLKVAGTEQRMKMSRVDVGTAVNKVGKPIFVATARGSVVLPKDGSWSLVTHNRGDGTVTPLPQHLAVPLIREGVWDFGAPINDEYKNALVRVAHPGELLRNAAPDTVNFGFLQNLNSQKVLYLTPAFKAGLPSLLSKTPPLLADAYRLMNTSGIFPNIGDAENNFGAAIQMLKGKAGSQAADAFSKVMNGTTAVLDGGAQVLEILEVKAREEAGKLVDQGFKLIKQKGNDALNDAFRFDLPSFAYPLVGKPDSAFRIYIEYAAKSNPKKAPKDYIGNYDFDVDSFAGDMAKQWKGRLNNLAMVVDLGPLKRLMTIKGNFNASKGDDTDFGSKKNATDDQSLPTPEIEFSEAIKPVIQILDILAQLSQGNYADALKKGLKVAMSNNANVWEYKFEATKDIPIVRFPPGDLYEAPQTPLKLEASMSLGVYFNAALKVTTDPKQLLPTAGAFFAFHGGLQVMCFSLGAGSIYAVGHVDLKLAADTSPLVSLDMKFGFGVQVGVGLPVVGNVSVLFMAGVEIYVDSNLTVKVTAFLLFRGHAEILGGLVGVTITIEAQGSIEKSGEDDAPCNCQAQVTFAIDISIFLVIDINFSKSWEETRQIA